MIDKTKVLELLSKAFNEWKEDVKGHNLPLHKFGTYEVLQKIINQVQQL